MPKAVDWVARSLTEGQLLAAGQSAGPTVMAAMRDNKACERIWANRATISGKATKKVVTILRSL
ncbi:MULTISPECIES: hypothetical protein [unclassified Streptomyces]|uniref:hypothetical protein n=1 Tax=unclassified Streptomyces TaxID=2593676 RepID=UPI00114D1ADD|nr:MULTISPECIES: hypothetical protein [unclassified Streptomyces]MEE1743733.1 hypothetical protein [Streptomyces sp. JV184]MYQ83318.1 hypothetical protein [Streptomyces sp. SID4936]